MYIRIFIVCVSSWLQLYIVVITRIITNKINLFWIVWSASSSLKFLSFKTIHIYIKIFYNKYTDNYLPELTLCFVNNSSSIVWNLFIFEAVSLILVNVYYLLRGHQLHCLYRQGRRELHLSQQLRSSSCELQTSAHPTALTTPPQQLTDWTAWNTWASLSSRKDAVESAAEKHQHWTLCKTAVAAAGTTMCSDPSIVQRPRDEHRPGRRRHLL